MPALEPLSAPHSLLLHPLAQDGDLGALIAHPARVVSASPVAGDVHGQWGMTGDLQPAAAPGPSAAIGKHPQKDECFPLSPQGLGRHASQCSSTT